MSNIALVATRKGLFKYIIDDAGQDWQLESSAFLGAPVSMVLAGIQRDDWYAALDHGHFGVKLHRSMDQGVSWQEISVPSYSVSEDTESGESLALIWSLEYAGKSQAQGLWAGTIPGGLFYSYIQGESWILNDSLWNCKERHQWMGGGYDKPGIHSICVDPDDDAHITVAVSTGGVWVTFDNGETWTNKAQGMRAAYMPPEKQYDPNVQDVHRIVSCPAKPKVFWGQHHNGIFRSTDNSESWQEIENVSPSTFGFAVAVHPDNPDTAWFVPGVKDECRIPVDGRLVVTRTRDGGASFESLTQGLPDEPSYDLVYRHGLDIDTSGNQLIMGSTTGNLWISGDQGDHWRCISNYLPPVHCVRFVK